MNRMERVNRYFDQVSPDELVAALERAGFIVGSKQEAIKLAFTFAAPTARPTRIVVRPEVSEWVVGGELAA